MAGGSQLELEPQRCCVNHWRWCSRESKREEISWLLLSYCWKQKEVVKPGDLPERSKRGWFWSPLQFNSSLMVNFTFYWVSPCSLFSRGSNHQSLYQVLWKPRGESSQACCGCAGRTIWGPRGEREFAGWNRSILEGLACQKSRGGARQAAKGKGTVVW